MQREGTESVDLMVIHELLVVLGRNKVNTANLDIIPIYPRLHHNTVSKFCSTERHASKNMFVYIYKLEQMICEARQENQGR